MNKPRGHTRLHWLAMMVGVSLSLCAAKAHAQSAPTVYVYLQTSIKPRQLEKLLEARMPGINVTVFGRARDLQKTTKASPPDAVVAITPILKNLGLTPTLQGQRDNDTTEPYVMMSVGELRPEDLPTKTIGIVDLLGRRNMGGFVATLLQLPQAPRLKAVTKIADLLPLLQFRAADVVILPKAHVEELRAKSQLNLQWAPLRTARVGLPGLAILSDNHKDTISSALLRLDASLNHKMGVHAWRRP